MNRTRASLIAAGTIRPSDKPTSSVQADSRAVQARQRDAGRVCKALATLSRAAERPAADTTDRKGRRVVDARSVRPCAYVGR